MKRHGNLWEKIIGFDNLLLAYNRAKKGKGWRRSVKKFDKDLLDNLFKIQKLLIDGKYKTSKYAEKIVYEPKQRTIYKLPFSPDRIVQHAVLQVVIPIWNNLMIHDSYACRSGKGMHQASSKTMQHIRNYKYCFKGDISKFYPSIDHDILMGIIKKKIKCVKTLEILEDIVYSYGGGKNVPIGNYTSQWFGNLYMNELDTYVKHDLNTKAYIRYCDDFILFSNSKRELNEKKNLVEKFIADKLKLKFSKWSIFPTSHGVDFLGFRHFINRVLLRKSTVKRIKKRINLLPSKLLNKSITTEQFRSSIASTEGWIKWANSYNLHNYLKITHLKEQYL